MRKYSPRDRALIVSWYQGQGLEAPPEKCLSRVGYVNDSAAGWLYSTDSNVALIENLITNPASGLHKRGKALAQVCIGLLRYAKDQGYEHILGITEFASVGKLGHKLGFKLLPHKLWVRSETK